MAHRNYRIALGIALAGLLAGACTATVEEEETGAETEQQSGPTQTGTTQTGTGSGTSTGTGSEGGTGTGCGAGPEEWPPFESYVSDCGGFPSPADGTDEEPPPPYCDAELLHWSYDATTSTLELLDARVELNCCGDHTMSIQEFNGVYEITETDAPEGGDGRCFCTCVFDFGLSAQYVPEQPITVRLIRHVTDEGAPTVVFEGELDLTQGSGWEIVDDTPAMFCGEGPVS